VAKRTFARGLFIISDGESQLACTRSSDLIQARQVSEGETSEEYPPKSEYRDEQHTAENLW
jgi:hypothetical protein